MEAEASSETRLERTPTLRPIGQQSVAEEAEFESAEGAEGAAEGAAVRGRMRVTPLVAVTPLVGLAMAAAQ